MLQAAGLPCQPELEGTTDMTSCALRAAMAGTSRLRRYGTEGPLTSASTWYPRPDGDAAQEPRRDAGLRPLRPPGLRPGSGEAGDEASDDAPVDEPADEPEDDGEVDDDDTDTRDAAVLERRGACTGAWTGAMPWPPWPCGWPAGPRSPWTWPAW